MDIFWTMVIFFLWISWFWILITVLMDLFRRHDVGGWTKALWMLFVLFLPFLGVFIYLVAEGKSMGERRMKEMQDSQAAFDSYVKDVAASTGPADQIAKAKQLLDSGAIDQAEYDSLKRAALAT